MDGIKIASIQSETLADGYALFWDCNNLTEAYLINVKGAIGGHMFRFATKLDKVVFGDGITSMGQYNLDWAYNLTYVQVPFLGNRITELSERGNHGTSWGMNWLYNTNSGYGGDDPTYSGKNASNYATDMILVHSILQITTLWLLQKKSVLTIYLTTHNMV